jgi:flagellar biosynthesis protein FlhF
MQVHTFIADSASDAVQRIRAELGPAAVVLSVRKLPRTGLERFVKKDQIEVLAGIEEPGMQAPPAQAPVDPLPDPIAELRAEIRQLREEVAVRPAPQPIVRLADPVRTDRRPGIAHILTQTGLMPAFAEAIVQKMTGVESLPIADQIQNAREILRAQWRSARTQHQPAVHIFMGTPGCGKSTLLCKMLAQTSLVDGQPAEVYQLDTHVANPSPQPSVYAEIVGARFERNAPIHFEQREENVFVDLPGVSLHNKKGIENLREMIRRFGVPEVHLVLNAAYESAHLLEQVRFFSTLPVSDLIVTHLDEETRWGKIWNLLLGTNFSVRSLGTGQNIPGDIHPANPDLILERQFSGK